MDILQNVPIALDLSHTRHLTMTISSGWPDELALVDGSRCYLQRRTCSNGSEFQTQELLQDCTTNAKTMSRARMGPTWRLPVVRCLLEGLVSPRESLSQLRASLTTFSDPTRSRATYLWSSSFESSLLIA